MKRAMGEKELDRGLLRGIVQIYANDKGIEYEEAHRILSCNKLAPRFINQTTPYPPLPSDDAGDREGDPTTIQDDIDSLFDTEAQNDISM